MKGRVKLSLMTVALAIIIPVTWVALDDPGDYAPVGVHQLYDMDYGPAGVAQRCVQILRHTGTGEIKLGVVHECDEGTAPRPLGGGE